MKKSFTMNSKGKYNPVLLFFVLISLVAALYLCQLRDTIEKNSDTVEMTADYRAITMMADREAVDRSKLLADFKKAGITTLAVYETNLDRLDKDGDVIAVPGSVLRDAKPGYRQGVFDDLIGLNAASSAKKADRPIKSDAVYVAQAPGSDSRIFKEAEKGLRIRYGSLCRNLPFAPKVLEVKGDARVLEKFDFTTKPPILYSPIGLSTIELEAIRDAGFKAAIRPQNNMPPTREEIDNIFQTATGVKGLEVTSYIPCGTEMLGYPGLLGYTAEKLEENNITLGLMEHVTQLQFAKVAGLKEMLQDVNYHAARVYNIAPAENAKLMVPDALRRWALADEERNIRINYLRFFIKPQLGVDIIPMNLKYVEDVKKSVIDRGYKIGRASVMELPEAGSWNEKMKTGGTADSQAKLFGKAWFPANPLLMVVALGICSCGTMLLGLYFKKFRGVMQVAVAVLGTVVAAAVFYTPYNHVMRQALALVAAVSCPVLSISFLMSLWDKMAAERAAKSAAKKFASAKSASATSEKGSFYIIFTALWQLALAICLSLVGAALLASILGDTRFFLEADIYRGVKLTFILPVLATLLLCLERYNIFATNSDEESKALPLVKQAEKIFTMKLSLGYVIVLFIVLFVLYIFVGRSGHTDGVPVPALEIRMRLFLEQVMYARPREKEFLIGHPAFFLAVLAAIKNAPMLVRTVLTVGAVIGQASLVQTFCHMRTPVMMSLIRAVDGYFLGAALGIIALVLVISALPLAGKIKRRFTLNE